MRERRLLLLLSLVSRRSCACGSFVIGAVSYFSIFEEFSCSCARWLLTLISERQGDAMAGDKGWGGVSS